MFRKLAALLLHLSMLALVCAIGAYWAIRIFTPAPASVPPPPPAAALREADPVLAARMFGLVQSAPVKQALNVQALGAYAAGKQSAAVLAVDGKPARVYLLNQEVASGAKLVEVRKDAVTIEQGGVHREVMLPLPPALGTGGKPQPPGYTRDGNTLTAPSVAAAAQPGAAPRPLQQRPQVVQQPVPQPQMPLHMPQVQQLPQPQAAQPEEDEAAAGDSPPAPVRRSSRNRSLAQ